MGSDKSRFVEVGRLSKNFGIDEGVKTFFIRADCDKCFKWECVASYGGDVKDRDFTVDYFECLSCDKIVCDVCLGEQPEAKKICPFCGNRELKRLTPKRILECHTCITESKLLCPVCDYLD